MRSARSKNFSCSNVVVESAEREGTTSSAEAEERIEEVEARDVVGEKEEVVEEEEEEDGEEEDGEEEEEALTEFPILFRSDGDETKQKTTVCVANLIIIINSVLPRRHQQMGIS